METIDDAVEKAICWKEKLDSFWSKDEEPNVVFYSRDYQGMEVVKDIKRQSINAVNVLFLSINENGLLDPDTMWKYAAFEGYLDNTCFYHRAAVPEDLQEAKRLLDYFIDSHTKNPKA